MSKIFDSVFRTLCERNSRLLIPVVNECFNKNYSINEKIDLLSGEHHIMPNAETDGTEERITDSCIRVCDKLYHIECQSTDDGTMVLRMVEYDFFIALEHASKSEAGIYEMQFPLSCVLYLRHNANTPNRQVMRISFPNGKSIEYEVPIFKVQSISYKEIIEKKLYFLIPYYILRYEKLDTDEGFQEMLKEYEVLHSALDKAHQDGILDGYEITNIQELLGEIIKYVAEKNQFVKKGAEKIMGGTVLETYADECVAKGKAEMKKAMKLIAQGCDTIEKLVENGVSVETAREALED